MGIPASSFSFVLAYFVHFFVVSVITLRGVQHGGGNKKPHSPHPKANSSARRFVAFALSLFTIVTFALHTRLGPQRHAGFSFGRLRVREEG